jgi:hypothetical protein
MRVEKCVEFAKEVKGQTCCMQHSVMRCSAKGCKIKGKEQVECWINRLGEAKRCVTGYDMYFIPDIRFCFSKNYRALVNTNIVACNNISGL